MSFNKTDKSSLKLSEENVVKNKISETNKPKAEINLKKQLNLINSNIKVDSKGFFFDKTNKISLKQLNNLKSKSKMKNSLSIDSLSKKSNDNLNIKKRNSLGLNLISQFKNEKTNQIKKKSDYILFKNDKEEYTCRICLDSITIDEANENLKENFEKKIFIENKPGFDTKTTCNSKINYNLNANKLNSKFDPKINLKNGSYKKAGSSLNVNSKNFKFGSLSKNNPGINQNSKLNNFRNSSNSENILNSMNKTNSQQNTENFFVKANNILFKDKNEIRSLKENYLAPCDCKGQSKYVHRRCLNEWIYISKKTKCQVCLVNFKNIKLKVIKKSIIKWFIDEYDHFLLLILYMIPFTIDCLLMLSFLKFNLKGSLLVDNSTINFNDQWIMNEINQSNQTNEQNLKIPIFFNKLNDIFSFVNFERSKKVTSFNQTLSLDMFVHNLYFLELKFNFKNLILSLTGIPLTVLISLPSLILFFRYCKSRYIEWQTENLDILVDN